MNGQARRTRIVCLSDTHNQTPALPAGDILIHAGDLTNTGSYKELQRAVSWLSRQKHQVKIVIAGNHDTTLDEGFYTASGSKIHNTQPRDPAECRKLLRETHGIIYLDHEAVEVTLSSPDGQSTRLKVFGSPRVPDCGPWAFCYHDEETAQKLWDRIPLDTDILITHTPPHGILDSDSKNGMSGCPALSAALERVRPLIHVCGHIHEARGAKRQRWESYIPLAEAEAEEWEDPGQGSNQKLSIVDLTGRKGRRLNDFNAKAGKWVGEGNGLRDQTRWETCIVNAAIMAQSHGVAGQPRLNKPIVVDLNLPVEEEAQVKSYTHLGVG